MKQFAVISIAFLYLSFAIGFQLNMHFCAGKLISISVTQQKNTCKKCGSKLMKGCCKDIQKQLKVSESDFLKTLNFVAFKITNFLYVVESQIKLSFIGYVNFTEPSNLSPYFLDSSKPIFVKNCTFVI